MPAANSFSRHLTLSQEIRGRFVQMMRRGRRRRGERVGGGTWNFRALLLPRRGVRGGRRWRGAVFDSLHTTCNSSRRHNPCREGCVAWGEGLRDAAERALRTMDLRAAAERARRDAASEGLTLVRADNATGFKGVTRNERKSKSKPYVATLKKQQVHHIQPGLPEVPQAVRAAGRETQGPPRAAFGRRTGMGPGRVNVGRQGAAEHHRLSGVS